MKKNDFLQIKGLDVKELKIKLVSIKKELAELAMEKNTKKLKDLKMPNKKKKELAQILTILNQKQQLVELEAKVEAKKPAEEKVAQKTIKKDKKDK